MAALAESIKAEGIRNPLHVRRLADDRYEVLAAGVLPKCETLC